MKRCAIFAAWRISAFETINKCPKKGNRKETNMTNVTIDQGKLKAAMDQALLKLDGLMEKFTEDFPSASSKGGQYEHSSNRLGWTQCFYTGMLFLAYEYTKDEKYLNHAKNLVETFIDRLDNMLGMNDHDIGFNFTLSTVAAYKCTGEKRYLEKSLAAAAVLGDRFREKGQFIQLAGDANCESKAPYRLIIDCLMNINLLFFAGSVSGDSEFTRKAFSHFNTTMETVVRDDGSTYQNFYFDPQTGERLGGGTRQGKSDTSCWARGQSWGVAGVPLTYAYMHNDEALDKYYSLVDYYIARLPKDSVAYWDMDYIDGDEPRDSSAAAIAVCGLIEALKNMPLDAEHKARYTKVMNDILASLIDNYAAVEGDGNDGLLLHGTYYYAGKIGVDECCIWGDYFYLEALCRLLNPDFKKFW